MKNQLYIIILLQVFFLQKISAQTDIWDYDLYLVGKLYPGYIIKTNGEKVEGFIEAQQRAEIAGVGNSNQTRVIFYTDAKDKKSKEIYKPEDVSAYMIADKHYKAMAYSGGLMKNPIRFLLLVEGGQIAQFTWYSNTGVVNGIYTWEEKMVFQKGDEEPKSSDEFALKFADKMSALVSDYSELSTKVANKEKGYGIISILEIIAEYNTWYKSNH